MIVTIHQPNYLPYLGFFHKMANADVLVLYDTAQYSKQLGFHNRNRIKTPQGAQWLTVPVQHATLRAIRDVQIVDEPWALRHRQALDANYRRAPCRAPYVCLASCACTPTPYPQLFRAFLATLAARDAVCNCGVSITLRKMFGDASG